MPSEARDERENEVVEPSNSTPLSRVDRTQWLCVRIVWLAMSVATLGYVARFGRSLPYMEDWLIVPVLSRGEPFRFAWLFEQIVEHRFILARIILYPLWQATYDPRVGIVLNACLLSGLAYVAIRTVRKVRDRASYSDACIPLILLHFAHAENVIFFLSLSYILPVVMLTAVATILVTEAWRTHRWVLWTLAACIVLQPLNGAIGLLYTPAIVAWCIAAAVGEARTGDDAARRSAWVLGSSAVGVSVLSALYFVGYNAPRVGTGGSPSLHAFLQTAVEIFSVGFGAAGAWLWPYGGLVVGAIVLCGMCSAAFAIIRREGDRLTALGLLASMASVAMLVSGIAWGRAVLGPTAGIPARYSLLITPALIAAYLSSVRYAERDRTPVLQQVIFVCAVALLWPNTEVGLTYGRQRADQADAVVRDLELGLPLEDVAARDAGSTFPNSQAFAERLGMLREQHSGPFVSDSLYDVHDPCQEADVGLLPIVWHDVELRDGRFDCMSDDPYVVYALDTPRAVCCVRVTYRFDRVESDKATMQAYWSLSGSNDFDERRTSRLQVDASPGVHVATFWVLDRIDRLRIDPDSRPCNITIDRIEFLVR